MTDLRARYDGGQLKVAIGAGREIIRAVMDREVLTDGAKRWGLSPEPSPREQVALIEGNAPLFREIINCKRHVIAAMENKSVADIRKVRLERRDLESIDRTR